MEINKSDVQRVLDWYGIDLEDIICGGKHKTPTAEQDWIYLIHHFHPPKKAEDMETLHHCFMYEKKNLKGDEYEQMHVKDGKVFLHAIKTNDVEKAPRTVYDHLNNAFKVRVKDINDKKYAIITVHIKLSEIKWSNQDKGELL